MPSQKSFEENMKRLEEITQTLEKGAIPLDESIALFEEGSALVRKCSTMLDKAEKKVKLLTANESMPEFLNFDERTADNNDKS